MIKGEDQGYLTGGNIIDVLHFKTIRDEWIVSQSAEAQGIWQILKSTNEVFSAAGINDSHDPLWFMHKGIYIPYDIQV